MRKRERVRAKSMSESERERERVVVVERARESMKRGSGGSENKAVSKKNKTLLSDCFQQLRSKAKINTPTPAGYGVKAA